jgi:hypothetical protein
VGRARIEEHPCFGPGRSRPHKAADFGITASCVVCIVATARTVVPLLSAALAGCAPGPSPQWLDARAGAGSSGKRRAIPGPRPVSDGLHRSGQGMAARGYLPR